MNGGLAPASTRRAATRNVSPLADGKRNPPVSVESPAYSGVAIDSVRGTRKRRPISYTIRAVASAVVSLNQRSERSSSLT